MCRVVRIQQVIAFLTSDHEKNELIDILSVVSFNYRELVVFILFNMIKFLDLKGIYNGPPSMRIWLQRYPCDYIQSDGGPCDWPKEKQLKNTGIIYQKGQTGHSIQSISESK